MGMIANPIKSNKFIELLVTKLYTKALTIPNMYPCVLFKTCGVRKYTRMLIQSL